MTELQKLRSRALGALDLNGWDARFSKQMAAHAEARPNLRLTQRQALFIAVLAWRHRSQMPAHLVPAQDPDDGKSSWTMSSDDSEAD